ncbi:MAG TPA: hypothetical protein VFM48_08610 [Aquabacterium sp.]|nr:hypothetical protein [Aquabacterium sp.]
MTYAKDIAKAVDAFIDMERKAKAWDEMEQHLQTLETESQLPQLMIDMMRRFLGEQK